MCEGRALALVAFLVVPSLVILGGGPAGNTCASVAATLGADVTLVERDIVGGAAHLWDCIPSKALIATGGELVELGRAHAMGLSAEGRLDIEALRERVASIEDRLHRAITTQLASQQVRVIHGTGRFKGPHEIVVETANGIEELSADFVLLATGSRPRVPDFVPVDHERVLITRDAYPPPEVPEHAIVIGSGVTGVEFTHLFDSLGAKVTLLVSRQQVLPIKDAEVAAVLEEAFLARGITLLKGARATAVEREGNLVRSLRGWPRGRRLARAARGGFLAQQRGSRARGSRSGDGRRGLRPGESQLHVQCRTRVRSW